MQVLEGSSSNKNASAAITEASQDWDDHASPDIVFVFHSSHQQASEVAAILADRFPQSLVVGATTAGEWINGQHQRDSLLLLGIQSTNIRWAVCMVESVHDFDAQECSRVSHQLLKQLDINFTDLNPERHFCLSFFDGMSQCEENIVSMISSELNNIPLIGGSAGDDLKFETTFVLANGIARQHAAVFVLAECLLPFKTIKHQHFIPGPINTVITKADVTTRTVFHLDGMPAAHRYAQLLNLKTEDLNPDIFSEHPLLYQYQNERYVRSIGQVGENNSLIFYCAIEEGMILNLASHQNMIQQFKHPIQNMKSDSNPIKLILLCNCVLRQLESESMQCTQKMARALHSISQHVIGFDTYGEQWQGLHINQTMVALAIYE